MANPLKLEDLVPVGSTFTLAARPEKVYRLRPVSMEDELWMSREFPDLEKIFQEVRMKEIARIVFHQLEEEDKQDFLAQDVDFVNDEGEKATHRIGGYRLLFALIRGVNEKMNIFYALLATIGVSRPMIDTLVAADAEKKSQPLPLTGE